MINNTYKFDEKMMSEIGHALWLARQEKRLFIYQVAKRVRVPIDMIDVMELGKAFDVGACQKLLKFYGKSMRIVFDSIIK